MKSVKLAVDHFDPTLGLKFIHDDFLPGIMMSRVFLVIISGQIMMSGRLMMSGWLDDDVWSGKDIMLSTVFLVMTSLGQVAVQQAK